MSVRKAKQSANKFFLKGNMVKKGEF